MDNTNLAIVATGPAGAFGLTLEPAGDWIATGIIPITGITGLTFVNYSVTARAKVWYLIWLI